jgi:transposase
MKPNPHTDEIFELVKKQGMAPVEVARQLGGKLTYSSVYSVIKRGRRDGLIPTINKKATDRKRSLSHKMAVSKIRVGNTLDEVCRAMDDEMIERLLIEVSKRRYSNINEFLVDYALDTLIK